MLNLISIDYQSTLKRMHETTKWGGDGHIHASDISFFAGMISAKTILDYGCGRGTLKPRLEADKRKLEVFEYDPGVIGKEKLPFVVDLVVCTDVLEHVEPANLDKVLKHLHSLAKKGIFLVICCRAANSVLPDGRNAHLIIQPPEWWLDKLAEYFPDFEIKTKMNPKVLKAWLQRI